MGREKRPARQWKMRPESGLLSSGCTSYKELEIPECVNSAKHQVSPGRANPQTYVWQTNRSISGWTLRPNKLGTIDHYPNATGSRRWKLLS